MKRFTYSCLTCFAAFMLVTTASANPSSWPQKSITIVVPFAAGGGTDSIAREFAVELSKELGKSVVVENRGGGGGSIGAAKVAQSKPDGYTLLFATSTFATNAAWETNSSYNPKTSFTPIALLGSGPLLLVANKTLGVKTVGDLLKKAKGEPDSINYCSAGPGSINHLSGALFQKRTDTQITHAPYRGSGPAAMDLVAGRVQIFFAPVPMLLGYVKDNMVELLAVTSKERSVLFPSIPTMEETGVKNFNVSTWWGLLGPAELPQGIVEKLNATTNKITSNKLLSDRFTAEGAMIFKGTPADFATKLQNELAMWKEVVTGMH